MQGVFGVILLLAVLSACVSFQPVVGDCFNGSYDNCATCYQTLVNAMLNTDDNKYDLSRGFFPPDSTPPVVVRVKYHFKGCNVSRSNATHCDTVWYWTQGTFYIYQPLEIFMFRSLFFSPINSRQDSLDLNLPDECSVDGSQNFFKLLTQRVSFA